MFSNAPDFLLDVVFSSVNLDVPNFNEKNLKNGCALMCSLQNESPAIGHRTTGYMYIKASSSLQHFHS